MSRLICQFSFCVGEKGGKKGTGYFFLKIGTATIFQRIGTKRNSPRRKSSLSPFSPSFSPFSRVSFFCRIIGLFILYFIVGLVAKKLFILFLIFLLTAPGFLPPAYSLLSPFCDQALPLWWEIKILLISEGNYKVDEEKSSYSARYSFMLLWTGCMERDNGDYVLYYENSELLSFEAREKCVFPESVQIISAEDFRDKPSIKLNYILRKGENLHFDFIVKSFLIPQSKSVNKFYLNLPASEENSYHSSEIDYDSFVSKGSNLIFLDEKEIYLAAVEKKFAWEWKYQKWHITQNKPVSFFNTHDVEVKISLDPHF